MADLTQIELPNGTTYNITDNTKVAKNAELLTTNPFAPNSLQGPYISKIDNAFYVADKRWNVTATNSSSSVSALFDGNYETQFQITDSKTSVITMDFTNDPEGHFPGYPYGYILISFYHVCKPSNVSGRVYCTYEPHGIGWHNISFSPLSDITVSQITYRSEHQGYYGISKLEITIVGDTTNSYGYTGATQIEMHLDRPASDKTPFLSKYGPETLYYDLTAPKFIGALQGNADTATSAGSATKATKDESGNNIKATYANSFSISDHTITLKNKNGGSLGTVTVPDNNTTYTFANGTNGFTVTPSDGSAQTVTVTPSITNNVTGSGTNGYIAKFNGANTITNGPAIGSGTTKFLREDGSWQTPAYPTVNNGTLTLQKNGTSVGTFTANQSGNTTANFALHEEDITPLVHKTYASTSYYATTSSDYNTSSWYFMSIRPTSWYKPWTVKMRIHSFCPNYESYESYTYSTISGRSDDFVYANWNERQNTAHYYQTLYRLKKAGYDAGYGHALGISIIYGDNYTNSNYYRTFEVDYYYCENCTVTILDTPVTWANWTGTGTTNYNSLSAINAVSRGLQESGDADSTGYNIRKIYSLIKAGSNKVFPYTFIMENSDGRWESIVTSNSTGTGKSRNTHGFKLGTILFMGQSSTYNENVVLDNYRLWYMQSDLLDHRYSFNTANDSTNGTTANKPVYLVGTLNASDGLFYLDTKWWTQTLPTTADGKLYIYLGMAYDYYRMTFDLENPIYHYVNGMLREFTQDAGTVNGFTVEKSVPSNAVFTDNNTTYTFANGTNGFTVTPSGGSAQTVTVTPSITNNVTGSGTSGYLTKFNGANTITNGPQLGSDTTKFLRNDGSWAVPPTASGGNKIFIVEPTPPYSVGDLWVVDDNNISVCVTARASGSFDDDDWGSAVDAISNEDLHDAITSTLTVVTGGSASGGNIILKMDEDNVPYELLVTDTPTNITSNTAKIYRWDGNGLRFSSTGYNGTYSTIINTSGQIPAQYLTGNLNAGVVAIQNFTAAMVHGGVLTRGKANNQDGTIEVYDANGTIIAEINNLGVKYYGQGTGADRPYYLINTSGFIGYTKVNGTWTQTVKVAFDEFRMVKGYVRDELDIGGKIKLIPMDTGTNSGIAFVAVT